jgi:hypothetical protein
MTDAVDRDDFITYPTNRAVYIVDVDHGIAYASISPPAGPPRHVKGTIRRVQ